MKLDSSFVTETMRVLFGRVPSVPEGALQAGRLGSVEEFLAWIVLRENIGNSEPQIAARLGELARSHVSNAQTTRKEVGFPIETQRALDELRIALGSLIKADGAAQSEQAGAYQAMVRFSRSGEATPALMRYYLGLKL